MRDKSGAGEPVPRLLLGVTALVPPPHLDSVKCEVVSRQSLKIHLVIMLKSIICASRTGDIGCGGLCLVHESCIMFRTEKVTLAD